jgi:PAS domain S-box-containing protein
MKDRESIWVNEKMAQALKREGVFSFLNKNTYRGEVLMTRPIAYSQGLLGKLLDSQSLHTAEGLLRNKRGQGIRSLTTPVGDTYPTLVNRDYVYEFANDAYCRVLGKSREDVLNRAVSDLWGHEAFDRIIKALLDRCFSGEMVEYEGWLRFPGDERRYYHIFHHPYSDEQGRITHVSVTLSDKTERKLEEEVLRKVESCFREAMKNMHFGVYSVDVEGRFTFVNDVMLERTGYSREWFSGESLFDFARPEDREEVRRCFRSSLDGVAVPPYEFGYQRASGDVSWVQVNAAPIWEKGRITGVLGVLLDITKRRRSEYALKESERKYRMLFSDSMDAIFITDRKGRLADANRSFLDLFGYSGEEAIGMDVVETYANPREREICVKEMNDKGCVRDFELKLRKKDGTVMECVLTGNTRRAEDETVLGYQGIVRDVTGLRSAEKAVRDGEEKLKSVVCGSSVPQFLIDGEHMVVYWNRALEVVSGIKAEEIVGTKEHWRAFYRTERPCMADLLVADAEAEIPDWYREKAGKGNGPGALYKAMDFFQELGPQGKWLYFSAAPVKNSEGMVVGAIETLEDVTEHRLAEDAIRRAEEKCRGILKAVSR